MLPCTSAAPLANQNADGRGLELFLFHRVLNAQGIQLNTIFFLRILRRKVVFRRLTGKRSPAGRGGQGNKRDLR